MIRSSSSRASRSTTGTGPWVSTAWRQASRPVYTSPPPPAPSTEQPRASAGRVSASISIAILQWHVGIVGAGVLRGDVPGTEIGEDRVRGTLRSVPEAASATGVQVDSCPRGDPQPRRLRVARAGAVRKLELERIGAG